MRYLASTTARIVYLLAIAAALLMAMPALSNPDAKLKNQQGHEQPVIRHIDGSIVIKTSDQRIASLPLASYRSELTSGGEMLIHTINLDYIDPELGYGAARLAVSDKDCSSTPKAGSALVIDPLGSKIIGRIKWSETDSSLESLSIVALCVIAQTRYGTMHKPTYF